MVEMTFFLVNINLKPWVIVIYVRWTLDIASLSGMSQAHALMRYVTERPGFFKHILNFHLLLKTNK